MRVQRGRARFLATGCLLSLSHLVLLVAPASPESCGKLTDIAAGNDSGFGLAIDSGGKIVVAGHSFNGTNFDFAVIRYNPDGSLDTTFDGDGIATTPIGGGDDFASAVAIQSDGKIVVAGRTDGGGGNLNFAVVRYNSNGSLDTSFNGTGIATHDHGGMFEFSDAVTFQPADGKIVVAGRTKGAQYDVAVLRYNTNGTLDTAFDTDGVVTTPVGASDDFGKAVKVQSTGEIVVGGFYNAGGPNKFFVLRYQSNGALDPTFDGDGVVTTSLGPGGDEIAGLVLQPDGKIVAAGQSFNGTNVDFAVARYNLNGSLDTSFDGDGIVTTPIGTGDDRGKAVALQPTGEIVVAGQSSNGADLDYAVVRYNANGSLDTSFSGDGKATARIGPGNDSGQGVGILPDSRIVVAGDSSNGSNQDFSISFFNSDGSQTCSVQVALHPTGIGSTNAFSSATGCLVTEHWDCLNDQAANAGVGAVAANDATTFLEDANGNTNREMFSLDNGTIPAGATILSLDVLAQVGKGTGASPSASVSYQRMGTDVVPVNGAGTLAPGACCSQLIQSSWSGLSWTPTDLDNLEIGIVHNSGGALRVSQLYALVTYEISTAVELASFSARSGDETVELVWETASELDNLGFHLYRSISEQGPYVRLTTRAIPGLGSSPTGARYRYQDEGLTNGSTYFYQLEDIETTGRTAKHGPVSATPNAGASPANENLGSASQGDGGTLITYGNPSLSSLRVVERGRGYVRIELRTEGFYAQPRDDGSVRIEIPDFEISADESPIPVRRAWVDAIAGRRVELVSVQEQDVVSIQGLRPAKADRTEVVATPDGIVRPGARRLTRRERSVDVVRGGLEPLEPARLLGSAFQGEIKKTLLELAPLRWNASEEQLLLSRRLLVQLSFMSADPNEFSSDGVRGRRYRPPAMRRSSGRLVARLATTGKGLYAVRYEEIFPEGRMRGPSSVRLSRQGKAVAYHLEPNRQFGPGSTLFFLSAGEQANPYGRQAVYELELGRDGDLMAEERAAPWGKGVSFYWHHAQQEENRLYQAGLLDAPDRWLWELIFAPEVKSLPFDVNALALEAVPSHLGVYLQGASDFPQSPDHHLRLYVNGTLLGERSWDGKRAQSIETELPPGLLHEGENRLEIENVGVVGVAYSMVMLDRFELTYPRAPKAIVGRLEASWPESGTAEVSGLGNGSRLLDVTDPLPRWLVGAEIERGGALRFGVESGRDYLAVSPEAILRPEIRSVRITHLQSENNRADYLLIAPEELLPAAGPLVRLRQSQGLRAKAVSTEEIYSEFGFGEENPQALKDFLAFAYHRWQRPSPRYVVLLGDATYDAKDYLRTGVKDRVPAPLVRTRYIWTASDPSYGAVNGEDFLPDVAIGRLPAESVDEARTMVQKILAFEEGDGTLRGPVFLIADNADAGGNFEADADELAATLLSSKTPAKIYLSRLGTEATRRAIRDAFDEGGSLMSYIGHGGIHLWASESVFDAGSVASLLPQAQQPVVLTMNCLNGYFHFPYFNSLAEELLKAEGRGAIATFSPSGLSTNRAAHVYHMALLQELFSGNHRRLGDAVMAAQSTYSDWGGFPDLLNIYHLFGDPAMTLK